jgi:hypothetical protein
MYRDARSSQVANATSQNVNKRAVNVRNESVPMRSSCAGGISSTCLSGICANIVNLAD